MTRTLRYLLPGVALLGIAGAALADPPGPGVTPITVAPTTTTVAESQAPAAPAVVQPSPENKMICKYETPTGSRLGGHRTCMKKSDWDALAADARHERDFSPPAGLSKQN
jgi:hypothetical protein